jgi:hypothetical protein
MIFNFINKSKLNQIPKASEVLNAYLKQQNYPPWTSYFVKQKDVINDQTNLTIFVNKLTEENRYLILRTGCFPFIKYHCTKIKRNELIDEKQIEFQNKFFNCIKVFNLGNSKFKIRKK